MHRPFHNSAARTCTCPSGCLAAAARDGQERGRALGQMWEWHPTAAHPLLSRPCPDPAAHPRPAGSRWSGPGPGPSRKASRSQTRPARPPTANRRATDSRCPVTRPADRQPRRGATAFLACQQPLSPSCAQTGYTRAAPRRVAAGPAAQRWPAPVGQTHSDTRVRATLTIRPILTSLSADMLAPMHYHYTWARPCGLHGSAPRPASRAAEACSPAASRPARDRRPHARRSPGSPGRSAPRSTRWCPSTAKGRGRHRSSWRAPSPARASSKTWPLQLCMYATRDRMGTECSFAHSLQAGCPKSFVLAAAAIAMGGGKRPHRRSAMQTCPGRSNRFASVEGDLLQAHSS
jgi:hypothetical protein